MEEEVEEEVEVEEAEMEESEIGEQEPSFAIGRSPSLLSSCLLVWLSRTCAAHRMNAASQPLQRGEMVRCRSSIRACCRT